MQQSMVHIIVYLKKYIYKEMFIYYFIMYNFKDNILKLSRTQDLNELKNEWVIVNEQADYSFDNCNVSAIKI